MPKLLLTVRWVRRLVPYLAVCLLIGGLQAGTALADEPESNQDQQPGTIQTGPHQFDPLKPWVFWSQHYLTQATKYQPQRERAMTEVEHHSQQFAADTMLKQVWEGMVRTSSNFYADLNSNHWVTPKIPPKKMVEFALQGVEEHPLFEYTVQRIDTSLKVFGPTIWDDHMRSEIRLTHNISAIMSEIQPYVPKIEIPLISETIVEHYIPGVAPSAPKIDYTTLSSTWNEQLANPQRLIAPFTTQLLEQYDLTYPNITETLHQSNLNRLWGDPGHWLNLEHLNRDRMDDQWRDYQQWNQDRFTEPILPTQYPNPSWNNLDHLKFEQFSQPNIPPLPDQQWNDFNHHDLNHTIP